MQCFHGPNGLLNQANEAKEQTKEAEVKENIGIAYNTATIKNYLSDEEKEKIITEELEIRYGKGNVTVVKEEKGYKVEIKNEGIYHIDESGNITADGTQIPTTPTTPKPVEQPEESEEEEFSRANGKIDIEFLTGTSYEIGEANKPQIDNKNMVPVNWNGNNWVVTDEENWEYSYDETEKKWANVMLRDTLELEDPSIEVKTAPIEEMKGKIVTQEGSMLVWIPRYAYKITYYEDESKAKVIGYSDARGIVDKDGKTPKGMNKPVTSIAVGENNYRPHPAFEDNGSTSSTRDYSQGEWREKLQGIWFGKFEATEKVDNKVTIRPNVLSYGSSPIEVFYTDAKDLGIANSHMAKNSEWGAMAYLTESKYGRNGETVTKNSQRTTGDGAYKTNVNQSTTNNIYGIYDTSGGSTEYTTSYIADGTVTYGNSFASTDGTTNNKAESTEYTTVYEKAEDNTSINNYKANVNKIFGDGVFETSTEEFGQAAWHSAGTEFPSANNPFFRRSDWYRGERPGIFAFFWSLGKEGLADGFRICMII